MMRDIRTKNWFWIENSLIDREDLEAYEKLIYMALVRYADNDGKCFPGLELLMKVTGIGSRKTLTKYLRSLEEKNLIEIKKRTGKGNIYFLKNVTEEPGAKVTVGAEMTRGKSDRTPGAKVTVGAEMTRGKSDRTPGAKVTVHQGQKCTPNNTQEQYTINNTQIKEKNKKGNITENLLDYIETLEIDSEKKKIFKEWVEYKKEKNQYKNTKSIDILIKRFIKYSVQELRDIVEKSIMNNYSGIFEPKEINKTDQGNNNEISKMTPEEREKMIKAKYFGGA